MSPKKYNYLCFNRKKSISTNNRRTIIYTIKYKVWMQRMRMQIFFPSIKGNYTNMSYKQYLIC